MLGRIQVVLADDHVILRDGLRALINAQPDLVVVGEAADGIEAVRVVKEFSPRVLCLDLSMPSWGGVRTIEKLKSESPNTRVLVLTMHNDPAYIRAALAAGAHGYMLKTAPVASLLAAIRGVAAGERVIDVHLQPLVGDTSPTPAGVEPIATLSRREREVLELLVLGHTHQEIAERLFVSVKTVETYRSRVREKTGLRTRADFVRYGLDAGLTMTEGESSDSETSLSSPD